MVMRVSRKGQTHDRRPLMERFLDRFVVDPSGCWLWAGPTTLGYGRIVFQDINCYAHRVAYELFVGELDPALTIDHLCRVRHCVNPDHVEQVTQGENNRRARRDECKRGHPFDDENTYQHRGRRVCRACRRRRKRAR